MFLPIEPKRVKTEFLQFFLLKTHLHNFHCTFIIVVTTSSPLKHLFTEAVELTAFLQAHVNLSLSLSPYLNFRFSRNCSIVTSSSSTKSDFPNSRSSSSAMAASDAR